MNLLGCRTPKRPSGIMLIECVVYVAVFAVILTLAFAALHRTWKSHAALQRNARDVTAALRAGEQWRDDIRQAVWPVEVSGLPEGGLVRIATSAGPVLYRLSAGGLLRDAPGHASFLMLTNVLSAVVEKDQRQQVAAWRWELELKSRAVKSKLRPLFTFLAVAPSPKQ